MFLTLDQLFTLLTTLLFLELFLGVLLVWAIFRLRQLQHNLGDLGHDKYKELLVWQQAVRADLMERYTMELNKLTEKAAKKFSLQLEESLKKLEKATTTGLSSVDAVIENQVEGLAASVAEANSELSNNLSADLTEYKAAKLAALEKSASDLALAAARELIGTQISTSESHTIVKRLLQEAWEEGALPNE